MINDLFKSIFTSWRNVLRFLQLFCLFYSFIILIHFLLDLAQSPVKTAFQWSVQPFYNMANMFYNNTMTVNQDKVSLTGAFLMFLMIGLSFLFKSLYELTESTEETYYKTRDDARIIDDEQQQKLIIQQYQVEMRKFNKLFVLFKLELSQNRLRMLDNQQVDDEVAILKSKFQNRFIDNIDSQGFRVIRSDKVTENKTSIVSEGVGSLDDVVEYINSSLQKFNSSNADTGIAFDCYTAVDIAKAMEPEEEKITFLEGLLNVVSPKETMCTATLKFCYELLNIQNFSCSSKGRYQIDGCESPHGEELFMLVKNYSQIVGAKVPE